MKKRIIVFFAVITFMLGIIVQGQEVYANEIIDVNTYKYVINFTDPTVSENKVFGHAYSLNGGERASYVMSILDSGKYLLEFSDFSKDFDGCYVLLDENKKEIDWGYIYGGKRVNFELEAGKYQLNILADKNITAFDYEFVFASSDYKMGEVENYQYNGGKGIHKLFDEKYNVFNMEESENKEITEETIFFKESELVKRDADEYTISISEDGDYSLIFIKHGDDTSGTGYYAIETESGDEVVAGYIRYTKKTKNPSHTINIKSIPAGKYKLKIGAVSEKLSYSVAFHNMKTTVDHMWIATCFKLAMPAKYYKYHTISDRNVVDIELNKNDDSKVMLHTKRKGVAIITYVYEGRYFVDIIGVIEENNKKAEVVVSFKKDSSGGIKPSIMFMNKSNSKVKKVAFDVYYYDKKGNKLKNKTNNNEMTRLTYSNVVEGWTSKSLKYNNTFYNKSVDTIVVKKITVTYSNGKTKTYTVNTKGVKK